MVHQWSEEEPEHSDIPGGGEQLVEGINLFASGTKADPRASKM